MSSPPALPAASSVAPRRGCASAGHQLAPSYDGHAYADASHPYYDENLLDRVSAEPPLCPIDADNQSLKQQDASSAAVACDSNNFGGVPSSLAACHQGANGGVGIIHNEEMCVARHEVCSAMHELSCTTRRNECDPGASADVVGLRSATAAGRVPAPNSDQQVLVTHTEQPQVKMRALPHAEHSMPNGLIGKEVEADLAGVAGQGRIDTVGGIGSHREQPPVNAMAVSGLVPSAAPTLRDARPSLMAQVKDGQSASSQPTGPPIFKPARKQRKKTDKQKAKDKLGAAKRRTPKALMKDKILDGLSPAEREECEVVAAAAAKRATIAIKEKTCKAKDRFGVLRAPDATWGAAEAAAARQREAEKLSLSRARGTPKQADAEARFNVAQKLAKALQTARSTEVGKAKLEALRAEADAARLRRQREPNHSRAGAADGHVGTPVGASSVPNGFGGVAVMDTQPDAVRAGKRGFHGKNAESGKSP